MNRYDHDRYASALHPGAVQAPGSMQHAGHYAPQIQHNGGLWTCRCCGYAGMAQQVTKASTAAWILVIVLAMACITLPICWLPLLVLRNTTTMCPRCATPYGTA